MNKNEATELVWGIYAEYERRILKALDIKAAVTPTIEIVNASLTLTQTTIQAMVLPPGKAEIVENIQGIMGLGEK